MSTGADVALACLSAFVDGLVDGGVRSACVSPGSRSTALALALARHPAVRVLVHLDERSSAFFALGLAKASGGPVAAACTSGTATANFLPAVVEASMSRVPLLLLTADRPPELRGVGANQTIDQVELYGRYVRSFADAPLPGDDLDVDAWRRRGAEAARSALAHPPGPVHVNLPFREPLVPGSPMTAGRAAGPGHLADGPSPDVASPDVASPDVASPDVASPDDGPSPDVGPLIDELRSTDRGVVYAGGLRSGGNDVVAIADTLGWPLIAEPHSGARLPGSLEAGRFLVGSERFMSGHTPDVVLQIGAAPTSRPGLALVGRTRRLVILDPDYVVGDPLRRATARVVGAPSSLRAAIDAAHETVHEAWTGEWRRASDRARSVVDELVDGWDEPFEGRVARDVADSLDRGSDLCAGSSMPIRDLDLFMRPRDGVRILANRGASGIDGFVSTTLGVAAAGRPTVGLLGDLTLLHDIGGLVWNARRGIHAVLVVLNNGGGAIFSLLEQRALPELDELFTTPHRVDLGAVVRAAGAGHHRVDRSTDLVPAVGAALRSGGVQVVEVAVDAERDRRRREEVRWAVEQALR